jgi:NADH-quinone oxidoreductase chain G
MISLIVNNVEFLVKSEISVLEACKYVGIYIPRFCYHETLSVAGNCRMCLVEVNELEKPVASCITLVEEGMIINTDTMFVKKARENVIEALLINHPLDCPICDQAGECDLQDQTKLFGGNHSRFFLNKRGVEDKNCGPLIKTIMTRCIHCTRCVRYGSEVAGLDYLGTLNRGMSTEIGSYISKMFSSEISGNVIDLCPVGALTSKPYAFKARPWELRICENIDLTDGLGSNIYVSFKETEILRVTPKSNSNINDNIISDKARFSYDSFTNNRIKSIYSKTNTGNFIKSDWSVVLNKIDCLLRENNSKITIFVNSDLDLESIFALKKIKNIFPNKISFLISDKCAENKNFFVHDFSKKIENLNKNSSNCFLISTNPKVECALLNAKLRMKYKQEFSYKYSFGPIFSAGNIPTTFVNLSSNFIGKLLEGKLNALSKIFLSSINPIVLLGESLTKDFNLIDICAELRYLNQTVDIFLILNKSNAFGAHLANIKNINKRDLKSSNISVVINHEDLFTTRKHINSKSRLNSFWINSHGSFSALKYEFILPALSSFEEENIYLNLEGRAQKTEVVFKNPIEAKSVKSIIPILFNPNSAEKNRSNSNNLLYIDEIIKCPNIFNSIKCLFLRDFLKKSCKNIVRKIYNYPLKSNKEDFYLSNSISRHSLIMSNCSSILRKESNNFVV